jgi:hypothetical protein
MNKLIYISIIFLLAGITFGQPKDILVNWECNMEIELLSGRFNPADTVAARGDFNGWGRHDLVVSIDPNVYVSAEPDTVLQAVVGDTIVAGYKFFYTPNSWEGGDNRIYILTQADYDAGTALVSRPFNDGTLATVTNQATEFLFQVDVDGAISALTTNPFPVINTVHLAGGTEPLQWPDLGWPDAQINLMIPLVDDGTMGDKIAGDMVFSTTVTIPAFTVFHMEYKFGINYGDAANNEGGNDNENAIGANHTVELFANAWYVETLDTFGIMGAKDFVTDVEDITQTIPTEYSIEQNFPNPFNPATRINFSIPNEGLVTLNVYNSLGQQVATLLNESKPAGTYQVDFDGAYLSSGIYFYQITSGNFTQTKKMILMK